MEINYKIEEADFLDFQLYTASKSERINKKKKNGWLFLVLGSLIIASFFYSKDNIWMTIYCCVVALTAGLFYPKYFNWRYKKHYQNFIKENYKNRFGEKIKLKLSEEFICSIDKTGEGKYKLKEIEVANETKNHFFLKASTGMSVIIPKRELEDVNLIRNELKAVGLRINSDENWVWR